MGKSTEIKDIDINSSRYKLILGAIVQEFILTAEPISSKTLSMKYSLGLSPASIRNKMAELERDGYLTQPHTSAGRVPTEKSFRFYVDALLELKEPAEIDKDLLRRCFGGGLDVEDALMETTRALSSLTGCAGLVLMPGREQFVIKQMRLLPMDSTSLIVLFVSSIGLVKTRVVRVGPEIKKLDLEKISNYLNSIAEGLTIGALRARIVEEMTKEKNLYDELLSNAFRLGAIALEEEGDASDEGAVYVEGQSNILEQPEFRDDFDRMKRLFTAFEEKSLLVRILDKSLEEGRINIAMGSESSIDEFRGLSFVTAPYSREGEIFGTLGVIGPVRMNYSKIIPLVTYTAGLLGKVF
jgi:heat-inducible transcriptional repressor